MKYPIHNRLAYFFLLWMDRLLSWVILKKKRSPTTPERILLCNTAHLGDVILTTSLLPVLHAAYPQAEIGFLVGSWAKPVLEGCYQLHYIDHWKINQSPKNKWRSYWNMRRQVLKELRSLKYDWAIDCGLHFPNMAPLLWQAKIPIRIGFTTPGFSPLLTHAFPWNFQENRSVVEAYFSLLPSLKHFKHLLHPTIPLPTRHPHNTIVIHMGSGNPQKNWPEENWIELCQYLTADGASLLFTGKGEIENDAIERVRAHLPHSENLCNQLTWEQFTATIVNTKLLIATDTSAGHIAAACKTPAVLLYTGIHPNNLWKPYKGRFTALTYPTPCSPCYTGCSAMTCLRNLSVITVYQACKEYLNNSASLS